MFIKNGYIIYGDNDTEKLFVEVKDTSFDVGSNFYEVMIKRNGTTEYRITSYSPVADPFKYLTELSRQPEFSSAKIMNQNELGLLRNICSRDNIVLSGNVMPIGPVPSVARVRLR